MRFANHEKESPLMYMHAYAMIGPLPFNYHKNAIMTYHFILRH